MASYTLKVSGFPYTGDGFGYTLSLLVDGKPVYSTSGNPAYGGFLLYDSAGRVNGSTPVSIPDGTHGVKLQITGGGFDNGGLNWQLIDASGVNVLSKVNYIAALLTNGYAFWINTSTGYVSPSFAEISNPYSYWSGYVLIRIIPPTSTGLAGAYIYNLFDLNLNLVQTLTGENYGTPPPPSPPPFYSRESLTDFAYDFGTNSLTVPPLLPPNTNSYTFDIMAGNGQVLKSQSVSLADFQTLQSVISSGKYPGSVILTNTEVYSATISPLSTITSFLASNTPDNTKLTIDASTLVETTIVGPLGVTHQITGDIKITNSMGFALQVQGDLGISQQIGSGVTVDIPVSVQADISQITLKFIASGDTAPFSTQSFPVTQKKSVTLTAVIKNIQAFINPQQLNVIAGIQADYEITNEDPVNPAIVNVQIGDYVEKSVSVTVPPSSIFDGSIQISYIEDFTQYQQTGGEVTISNSGNNLAQEQYEHASMSFTQGIMSGAPAGTVTPITVTPTPAPSPSTNPSSSGGSTGQSQTPTTNPSSSGGSTGQSQTPTTNPPSSSTPKPFNLSKTELIGIGVAVAAGATLAFIASTGAITRPKKKVLLNPEKYV